MATKERIAEILARPYSFIAAADQENGGWVIFYPDLPGVITQADTFEEVGEMAKDALEAWVESQVEEGAPVPEPRYTAEPEWDWETVTGDHEWRPERIPSMTAGEVAERLGVSVTRVHQLARDKHVGQIRGNVKLFSRLDVAKLERDRRKPGRPKRTRVLNRGSLAVPSQSKARREMHKQLAQRTRDAKKIRDAGRGDEERAAS